MFENVDGWTTDAGVTGILIAHLGAFGSGELKKFCQVCIMCLIIRMPNLNAIRSCILKLSNIW